MLRMLCEVFVGDWLDILSSSTSFDSWWHSLWDHCTQESTIVLCQLLPNFLNPAMMKRKISTLMSPSTLPQQPPQQQKPHPPTNMPPQTQQSRQQWPPPCHLGTGSLLSRRSHRGHLLLWCISFYTGQNNTMSLYGHLRCSRLWHFGTICRSRPLAYRLLRSLLELPFLITTCSYVPVFGDVLSMYWIPVCRTVRIFQNGTSIRVRECTLAFHLSIHLPLGS